MMCEFTGIDNTSSFPKAGEICHRTNRKILCQTNMPKSSHRFAAFIAIKFRHVASETTTPRSTIRIESYGRERKFVGKFRIQIICHEKKTFWGLYSLRKLNAKSKYCRGEKGTLARAFLARLHHLLKQKMVLWISFYVRESVVTVLQTFTNVAKTINSQDTYLVKTFSQFCLQ